MLRDTLPIISNAPSKIAPGENCVNSYVSPRLTDREQKKLPIRRTREDVTRIQSLFFIKIREAKKKYIQFFICVVCQKITTPMMTFAKALESLRDDQVEEKRRIRNASLYHSRYADLFQNTQFHLVGAISHFHLRRPS